MLHMLCTKPLPESARPPQHWGPLLPPAEDWELEVMGTVNSVARTNPTHATPAKVQVCYPRIPSAPFLHYELCLELYPFHIP